VEQLDHADRAVLRDRRGEARETGQTFVAVDAELAVPRLAIARDIGGARGDEAEATDRAAF